MAVLTAVVAGISYGWGIANNPTHYANATAVRGMSESWHNFLYGAFDPAGFLAIDRPPGGLWIQVLSVRIFGYHNWAMLLPGVLAGAAAVLVLFALVRRWAGNAPAVAAAVLLAATPVTVAATRINLVDPYLALVLVGAAYTFWRALETGAWKWLALTAVLIGYGFNVKLVPALLILPVLGLVYLACSAPPIAKRLVQLVAAGALTAAVASLWLIVVALTPASSRPYIDGTTSNSVRQMVWDYNTSSRFDGEAPRPQPGSLETPILRDGQPLPNDQGGEAGLARLFNDQLGGQISWLLPLAAIFLVAGLVASGRAPRTDRMRAGWLLWGGWLAVYGLAFSTTPNMHPYYTALLAPPIAAIVGAGFWYAATRWNAWVLPLGLLATGVWALVLLGREPDYLPWLRPLVAVATVVAVIATVVHRRGVRLPVLAPAAVVLTAVAVLAAPVAWIAPLFNQPSDPRLAFFQTFNPLAGPNPNAQSTGANQSSTGAPGAGGPGGAPHGGPQAGGPQAGGPQAGGPGAGGPGAGGPQAGGPQAGGPGAGGPQAGGPGAGGPQAGGPQAGGPQAGGPGAGGPQAGGPQAGGPQAGAPGAVPLPPPIAFWGMPTDLDPKLLEYLRANHRGERFHLATSGGTAASPYIRAGLSVMMMGGFGGTTPAITADGLARATQAGEVRYVILGGFSFDSPTGLARKEWIVKNCARVPPNAYTANPQMMFTSALFDCRARS